jgi:ribosome-associated protein
VTRGRQIEPEALALRLAEIADDKGARDLVALDVRELMGYTDYLLIATARNERQAKAVHDEIYHRMKREGWLPARVEGEREAEWILMDYLDCVVHVFTPELRRRYRLEVLWGEAPELELDLAGARGAA